MSTAPEMIPTRRSLLSRIKNPEDQQSWREFYDTYHGLIRAAAIRAGLSAHEAEDVVQDTLITVSRNIQKFSTDPGRGSFKNWLFQVTRSRIEDFRRKQRRAPVPLADLAPGNAEASTATTPMEHRLPDAAPLPDEQLDRTWEEEWRRNLQIRALDDLKQQVQARHFQIFFLHFIKEQPAKEVARALGANRALVSLVKHRLLPKYQAALREAEAQAGRPRVPAYPEKT
jgi:RNA polymerase sigma-70 factor (ECF subfamily)